MSALKDLHRRLHNRNNKDLLERKTSFDSYNTGDYKKDYSKEKEISRDFDLNKGVKKETLEDLNNKMKEVSLQKKDNSKWFYKKNFLISLGISLGVVFIVIASIFYVKYIQSSFKQENVLVEFEGNNSVKNGGLLVQKLSINNNNRVSLDSAKIKIIYPDELKPIENDFMTESGVNSFYIDIGNLKKYEIKEYELHFRVYSSSDVQTFIKTELIYQPDNFSSDFVKEDSHLVNIRGSIIGFSLISPNEAENGELLKFIGILENNTKQDFDNLILELDYRDTFDFKGADLEKVPNNENKFKIPKLARGEKMELGILGSFLSEVDLIETIRANILFDEGGGNFSEIVFDEESVKIISSRIILSQEIFGLKDSEKLIAETLNDLTYKINFKNNSKNPVSDLVLTVKIEGDLVELNSVRSLKNKGYFDKSKREFIWKASDVSTLKNLNPGKSGSVEFNLEIKDDFIPEIRRNQIIVTQARISSPNIDTQISTNKEMVSPEKIVKVETDLDVLISGRYDNSVFNNQGPIPVKEGEETNFTIKIELKNNFNQINNSKIKLKLPSGIIWKNSFQRSIGDVDFNDRANELTWYIDEVEDFIGYDKSSEELVFQIGLVPQKSTSSYNIVLVKDIQFNGQDDFTKNSVFKKIDEFKLREVRDYEF
jgi:hypothetical protein